MHVWNEINVPVETNSAAVAAIAAMTGSTIRHTCPALRVPMKSTAIMKASPNRASSSERQPWVESIASDSPEMAEFQAVHTATTMEALRHQLAISDIGMVRLVEDLVDVLIG